LPDKQTEQNKTKMKTLIILLLTAVSLLAQETTTTNACDGTIPTPIAFAGQYDGGVLCGTEAITLCDGRSPELYYFWRDGAMIAFGPDPTFLDYPGYGSFWYAMQVSVDGVRGELSEWVLVEIPLYVDPPLPWEE
jgi:hypothetical protein